MGKFKRVNVCANYLHEPVLSLILYYFNVTYRLTKWKTFKSRSNLKFFLKHDKIL